MKRSSNYEMYTTGGGYAGRGLKDFGPRIERIIACGPAAEEAYRIEQEQKRQACDEAMPAGQLGLFSGDVAA